MSRNSPRRQFHARLLSVLPDAEALRVMPNDMVARFAPFHRAILQTIDALDDYERKLDDVNAGGRYSETGKREIMLDFVGKTIAPKLAEMRRDVEQAISANIARKAGLGRREFPRDDVVGEMRRAEMRALLRSMAPADRHALALSEETLVRDAVLSAPPSMSGLTADIREKVQQMAVEKEHSVELAKLAALDAAAEAARVALKLTASDMSAHLAPEAVEG